LIEHAAGRLHYVLLCSEAPEGPSSSSRGGVPRLQCQELRARSVVLNSWIKWRGSGCTPPVPETLGVKNDSAGKLT